MSAFTLLDWTWTLAFLLLMVGGAFFFYRLARRSESDFFLAGRGLPWWLPASSVFSTQTATDTPDCGTERESLDARIAGLLQAPKRM